MVPIALKPRQVVVAALIRDTQGRYLASQRPSGKQGAGMWEFPGGKLERGESEQGALVRELREELGIEAIAMQPLPGWRGRDPDGIRLSFWGVDAFRGTATPREGQGIRWCRPSELATMAFLPADAPIVARLHLPPYYLISTAAEIGEDAFLARLQAVLAERPVLVQLREPWPLAQLQAFARVVGDLCHRHGARLLVNAAADEATGCADGVHLPARRLLDLHRRPAPQSVLVGASCHTLAELEHADRIGCDFAVLSPVKATPSHPDAIALGWGAFQDLAAAVSLPVYALGGMVWDDLARAREAGGHGVAVRSGAFSAGGDTGGQD